MVLVLIALAQICLVVCLIVCLFVRLAYLLADCVGLRHYYLGLGSSMVSRVYTFTNGWAGGAGVVLCAV